MKLTDRGKPMFSHLMHYHRRMVLALRGCDEAQWHMHKLAEYAALAK